MLILKLISRRLNIYLNFFFQFKKKTFLEDKISKIWHKDKISKILNKEKFQKIQTEKISKISNKKKFQKFQKKKKLTKKKMFFFPNRSYKKYKKF